jgi:1,2-diacylglycerol 3-alpha-glucosyltransferase
LAVLAHDEEVTRYVTGGQALLRTLNDATAGARALSELLAAPRDGASAAARHASVRDRFGWDSLRPAYVALLREVSAGGLDG